MSKPQKLLYFINIILITAAIILFTISNNNGPEIEKLNKGDKVSSLSLISLNDTVNVEFDQGLQRRSKFKSLVGLFIYSTLCEACELNYENWKNISNHNSLSKIKFYYINMTTNELGNGKINETHYYLPRDMKYFDKQFKVPGVPYTVIISESGTVEYSSVGLIDKKEIENILNNVR